MYEIHINTPLSNYFLFFLIIAAKEISTSSDFDVFHSLTLTNNYRLFVDTRTILTSHGDTNIHIVYILYTELQNDISTATRIRVHTHTRISKQFQTDHLCERDVSVFVWGCSLANLLLFVSVLLFKQPLSNWAPFSSTCLPALLALLNKPFTPLFIPFASAGCRCQQQTAVEPL